MDGIPDLTIDAGHPGNADARSHRQLLRCAINDFTDNLMARDQTRP